MQKVLVAVDDSNYSEEVFNYALERAEKLDYHLTFLQVVQAHRYGGRSIKEGIEEEIENAKMVTSKMEKRAAKKGIESKSEVITGADVNVEIAKYADNEDYDLIIIGVRGKSEPGTIHLGSVAKGVVNRASSSVLVVH